MFRNYVNVSVLPPMRDEHDKVLFIPVDQLQAQDFFKSASGFPENVITTIAKAQNMAEVDRLLQFAALQRQKSPDNKDASLADIINSIWPRSCQTPTEIALYSQRAAELQLEFDKNVNTTADAVADVSADVSADSATANATQK